MSAAIVVAEDIPADVLADPLAWADRARELVLACDDLGQLREMADQAKAILAYLQSKLGRASEEARRAAEVDLLTRRRIGELLPPAEHGGDRRSESRSSSPRELEIPKAAAHKARALAAVPPERLDAYLEQAREQKRPPSVAGALRAARVEQVRDQGEPEAARATSDLAALVEAVRSGAQQPFGCVYADPPWKYANQGTRGATNNHYVTMDQQALLGLPVAALAAENAHLHMWTTNVFLADALALVDAWGFRFVSMLVWIKKRLDVVDGSAVLSGRLGMGNYWRVDHELLLLGVRGSCPFARHDLPSVYVEPPGKHSAKPQGIRDLIETTSPGPRLEMFARTSGPGWTSWGNEVDAGDIAFGEVA